MSKRRSRPRAPNTSSDSAPAARPISVYKLARGLRELDELRADGQLDDAEYRLRRDKLLGNPTA